VLGEAGVGKTHLCDHFARDAASNGVRVLRGSCFESEQVLPFSLWANLIANANVAAEPQVLAAIPAASRAELGRLIPELDGTSPPRESAEAVLLFRAVEALFLQFAKSARLLLVLEDLHWADEMSLRLLCFLAHRRNGFWIGTARREEVTSAPFLQKALAELDRERHVFHLPIEPFSREQTEDLARQWAQHLQLQVASETWAEQVWTLSEGNALVIVESARSHAEGAFVDQLERLPVPERVRVMIRGRVQRLSLVARELLALATVYDGELPLETVRDMFAPAQLAAAAEELIEHQLMRVPRSKSPRGTGGESIAFTHVRIRETLYGEMLPMRRRLLHARTAAALERQSGSHSTGWLGRVGYHHLRAGEVESAIEYLVRFAEQARRGRPRVRAAATFTPFRDADRLADAPGVLSGLPRALRRSRVAARRRTHARR
jgi:predicted ATPase